MKFCTQIAADDRYTRTYTLHMPHCELGYGYWNFFILY